MIIFYRSGEIFTGKPKSDLDGELYTTHADLCGCCGARGYFGGIACPICKGSGKLMEKRIRLYTHEQLRLLGREQAKRDEAKEIETSEEAKRERAEYEEQLQKFRQENADFVQKLDSLSGPHWDVFKETIFTRLAKPSKKQVHLVEAEAAKRAAGAANMFIGRVGEKTSLRILIVKVLRVADWHETTLLTVARDLSGALVMYRGDVNLGKTGETVTITAGIRAHTEFAGLKQTFIERPKKHIDKDIYVT